MNLELSSPLKDVVAFPFKPKQYANKRACSFCSKTRDLTPENAPGSGSVLQKKKFEVLMA